MEEFNQGPISNHKSNSVHSMSVKRSKKEINTTKREKSSSSSIHSSNSLSEANSNLSRKKNALKNTLKKLEKYKESFS